MTRRTWVQVNGKLYEKGSEPEQVSGPFVLGDIAPYKSQITGEMIEGRAQHRAHLKQHGMIEVGNETKALLNMKRNVPRPSAKPHIIEAMRKHGRL